MEKGRLFVQRRKTELEQKRRQVESFIYALKEEESRKYMEFHGGKLEQKEYVAYKLWKDDRQRELEKQGEQYSDMIDSLKRNEETYLKQIRALVKLKDHKKLTKELIEVLIEKIYVYPGKRVEVVFAYSGDLMKEVAKA